MKFFEKTLNKIISFVSKYYLACIFALACAISVVLCIRGKYNFDETEKFVVCSLSCMLSCFFVKNLFYDEKYNLKNIISYLVGIGASILVVYYLSENRFDLKYAYIVILLLLNIYKCNINNNLYLGTYLSKVFSNVLMAFLLECVLATGILIIYGIYYALFGGRAFQPLLEFEAFQFICVISVGLMMSLVYVTDDISVFMKVLIKYIMFIMVLIGYTIVYYYFAKIILIRGIPSNQIFLISSCLFAVGMPVSLMVLGIGEEGLINNIAKIMPFIFIPCLFVQSFSLYLRIYHYGLTKVRYICILVLLIEISYIVIYIIRNKNLKIIFSVTIIYALIGYFVPFINIYELPTTLQLMVINDFKNNVDKYKSNKKLLGRAVGAYDYIRYDADTDINYDKTLNGLLTENECNILKGETDYSYTYTNDDRKYPKTVCGYGDYRTDELDIAGYKKLTKFNIDEDSKTIDVSKYINELEETFRKDKETIDNDYIDAFLKNRSNIIDIDANTRLILSYISLTYDIDAEKMKYYSIEGVKLER